MYKISEISGPPKVATFSKIPRFRVMNTIDDGNDGDDDGDDDDQEVFQKKCWRKVEE